MPDRVIYLEEDIHLDDSGVADSTAALQAAANTASPGDVVKAKRGAHYRLASCASLPNRGIVLPPGVHLDPNRATFSFEQTQPGTYGFRLLDGVKIWGEGKIWTSLSQNGSAQAIDHAPISAGCLYGADGSYNVPNPFTTTRCWKVGGGLEIDNAKPDGTGIQVFGQTDGFCLIEDVRVPDSTTIGTVIGADWLPRGQAAPGGDANIAQAKANFINGLLWTLHPGSIIINRISTGKLTNTNHVRLDGGPTVVRLSACHDVKVSNIVSEQASALYRNVGGDYGMEFARGIIRMRAGCKGNSAEKMLLSSHRGLNNAVQIDNIADNVARAQLLYNYEAMFNPTLPTDIMVRDVTVIRDQSVPGTPQKAFYVHHTKGVSLLDCNSIGASIGVHIDSSATSVRVRKGYHFDCSVEHQVDSPGSVAWI